MARQCNGSSALSQVRPRPVPIAAVSSGLGRERCCNASTAMPGNSGPMYRAGGQKDVSLLIALASQRSSAVAPGVAPFRPVLAENVDVAKLRGDGAKSPPGATLSYKATRILRSVSPMCSQRRGAESGLPRQGTPHAVRGLVARPVTAKIGQAHKAAVTVAMQTKPRSVSPTRISPAAVVALLPGAAAPNPRSPASKAFGAIDKGRGLLMGSHLASPSDLCSTGANTFQFRRAPSPPRPGVCSPPRCHSPQIQQATLLLDARHSPTRYSYTPVLRGNQSPRKTGGKGVIGDVSVGGVTNSSGLLAPEMSILSGMFDGTRSHEGLAKHFVVPKPIPCVASFLHLEPCTTTSTLAQQWVHGSPKGKVGGCVSVPTPPGVQPTQGVTKNNFTIAGNSQKASCSSVRPEADLRNINVGSAEMHLPYFPNPQLAGSAVQSLVNLASPRVISPLTPSVGMSNLRANEFDQTSEANSCSPCPKLIGCSCAFVPEPHGDARPGASGRSNSSPPQGKRREQTFDFNTSSIAALQNGIMACPHGGVNPECQRIVKIDLTSNSSSLSPRHCPGEADSPVGDSLVCQASCKAPLLRGPSKGESDESWQALSESAQLLVEQTEELRRVSRDLRGHVGPGGSSQPEGSARARSLTGKRHQREAPRNVAEAGQVHASLWHGLCEVGQHFGNTAAMPAAMPASLQTAALRCARSLWVSGENCPSDLGHNACLPLVDSENSEPCLGSVDDAYVALAGLVWHLTEGDVVLRGAKTKDVDDAAVDADIEPRANGILAGSTPNHNCGVTERLKCDG
eukprot:TRINITY_DN42948_c0_g1_i1.p1 TRINITY_DN42948_c0_g1~~TRINITY_DN42948_c0_g1_i1.p1  ORF type:complete len:796 (+),score=79.39 TRINITY_DN42948_c0_g1_i1:62-2449(+)